MVNRGISSPRASFYGRTSSRFNKMISSSGTSFNMCFFFSRFNRRISSPSTRFNRRISSSGTRFNKRISSSDTRFNRGISSLETRFNRGDIFSRYQV